MKSYKIFVAAVCVSWNWSKHNFFNIPHKNASQPVKCPEFCGLVWGGGVEGEGGKLDILDTFIPIISCLRSMVFS